MKNTRWKSKSPSRSQSPAIRVEAIIPQTAATAKTTQIMGGLPTLGVIDMDIIMTAIGVEEATGTEPRRAAFTGFLMFNLGVWGNS